MKSEEFEYVKSIDFRHVYCDNCGEKLCYILDSGWLSSKTNRYACCIACVNGLKGRIIWRLNLK